MTNRVSSHKQAHLDESDLRLVSLLDSDPRMTYTDVAQRLGVGRATAKAMIERLYRKGVTTVCFVDDWVKGYRSSVAFCLNTLPSSILDVATALAAMEEVQFVMLLTGPFDIIVTARFKTQNEIPDFVSRRLGKIPGILRHESMLYHEIKPGHPLRADSSAEASEHPPTLDELDFALIRELERDARETATALAAKLGSTRTTIQRRMNRLINDRVITLQIIWSSYAEGYRGAALLGIKVSPSRIKDVGKALAQHERVRAVLLCSGRYDVMAWITYEDQQDLIDFVTEEVGKIPGIMSVESSIALKLVKYDIGHVVGMESIPTARLTASPATDA